MEITGAFCAKWKHCVVGGHLRRERRFRLGESVADSRAKTTKETGSTVTEREEAHPVPGVGAAVFSSAVVLGSVVISVTGSVISSVSAGISPS
jgi:hypothetical protein